MTEGTSKTLPDGSPCTTGGADRKQVASGAAPWKILLLLALVVLATIIAYSPVLFNFFAGDDFVHLTWLTDAVKNPELIWRNFHSSWLDGTTTRFYRPLISVFMVGDYLLSGTNGMGFHLTNLACHLASTVFLFFILQSVSKHADTDGKPQLIWPLAAAALFGLYPLHPEAVSWITGRVDSIVTAFITASFWYYITWRTRGENLWLFATAFTMILALLSKEMAITLPALFFMWEFLLAQKSGGIVSRTLSSLKATWIFWLMLVGYFAVRRWALGTFVGGYDDSLFFVSNWGLFLGGWLHGLRMMLVPINKDLMGAHHFMTKLWEAALVSSIALTVWSVVRRRQLLAPFVFLCSWLALSLLPVYKIFTIADDLEGSRLAYLATAPLCALVTFGLAGSLTRKTKAIACSATAVLLICAGTLLWTNNQAWLRAGQESNQIRRELDSLYKSLAGDPQVLLIGLPDNLNGAYVCRNALVGMTRAPQMSRSVNNCLMVGGFEPILPFGYFKDSLAGAGDKVKIFRWDSAAKRFAQVSIPAGDGNGKSAFSFSGSALKQALTPEPAPSVSFKWKSDGSLEALGGAGLRGRPEIHINPGLKSCWSTEVLVVKFSIAPNGSSEKSKDMAVGADLLYSNDLHAESDLRRRVHAALSSGDNTVYFVLHGIPDWALGGNIRDMQLLLPAACREVVQSVELAKPDEVMPKVIFENSGYLGTKGFTHLGSGSQSQPIELDARGITGAASVELEITRPNLTFETQNTSEASRVIMKRLRCDTAHGTVLLKRSDFPAAGMYEARPRAFDSHGLPAGVAGDHIVISVDS